jgi:hypothetical protein
MCAHAHARAGGHSVSASSQDLLKSVCTRVRVHIHTQQADVARAELEEMKTLKEAGDDRIHMLELNFEELNGQSLVVREEALALKTQRDVARKELVCIPLCAGACVCLILVFSRTCKLTTHQYARAHMMECRCRSMANKCCKQ